MLLRIQQKLDPFGGRERLAIQGQVRQLIDEALRSGELVPHVPRLRLPGCSAGRAAAALSPGIQITPSQLFNIACVVATPRVGESISTTSACR